MKEKYGWKKNVGERKIWTRGKRQGREENEDERKTTRGKRREENYKDERKTTRTRVKRAESREGRKQAVASAATESSISASLDWVSFILRLFSSSLRSRNVVVSKCLFIEPLSLRARAFRSFAPCFSASSRFLCAFQCNMLFKLFIFWIALTCKYYVY